MNSVLVQMRMLHKLVAVAAVAFIFSLSGAQAQVTAFKQAVAEAASKDKAVAEFYMARGYKAIWTGKSGKDSQRRKALLQAFSTASAHGLPQNRYDPAALRAKLKAAKTGRSRGHLEVEMSRLFLQYASDMRSGVLIPSKIDEGIVRKIARWDRLKTLENFAKSSPKGFFKKLLPNTPEYARLMKEKLKLEKRLGQGGFGPKVGVASLKVGSSGSHVVSMRNRLISMGYMRKSAAKSYDGALQKSVQLFQLDHGLPTDGVAGKATMAQINKSATYRLQSIMVAMERERWFNVPRGKRHILVNLTDFSAKIIDNGKATFFSRTVVGENVSHKRSPEFSDMMDHMVINPTWHVPRSIAVRDYLPKLQRNRNALGHLNVVDARGRTVDRGSVDFSQFNKRTFPFNIKQPPSNTNALGLVKFMFPNKYNIYLHDSPAKSLFNRDVRAFSHGCVRVQKPFEFAYALLSKQESDPKAFFHAKLDSGVETRVNLKNPVPVHLIYRTAISKPKGGMEFRRDVYGRDAKIFDALIKAGVVLRAIRG